MSPAAATLSGADLARLRVRVAAHGGYQEAAIEDDALCRSIDAWAEQGVAIGAVLERAEHGDAELLSELVARCATGETYFFRQPEHFDLVARFLGRRAPPPARVRAWSAGCATGEEAYSIASLLVDYAARTGAEVEVVGTDRVARFVESARRGRYAPWSVRAPWLYETAIPSGSDLTILPEVMAVTSFEMRDLRASPSPQSLFDVVFCRNVLMYLDQASCAAALAQVMAGVKEGGLLFVGPMDLRAPPPGFVPFEDAVGVFMRQRDVPRPAPRPPAAPSKRPEPRARTAQRRRQAPPLASVAVRQRSAPLESVAVRQRSAPPLTSSPQDRTATEAAAEAAALALSWVRAGELGRASQALAATRSRSDAWLVVLLELALAYARSGRAMEARRLMRKVVETTDSMRLDVLLPTPEEPTVAYVRACAVAFLDSQRGPRHGEF